MPGWSAAHCGPAPLTIPALLASIEGGNASDAALHYQWQRYATAIGGADSVPPDLGRVVSEGHAGVQRVAGADGRLRVAVGVPVRAVDAEWYELFPLDDVDRTLGLLARSSILAAAAASLIAGRSDGCRPGASSGPSARSGKAAGAIAGGDLATRLPVPRRSPT